MEKNRLPRLKVFNEKGHPNNCRYIVTEKGEPFFYLGDTAWELFHRLTRNEVEEYFKDRSDKGFTVIQAVVLPELNMNEPNAEGYIPIYNNDPTQPNEDYFNFVDWVVDKAEEYGLYIGMLPTWGDKVNKKWGIGPEIFTPENAKIYGEFLGKRYKNKPIIWILGGDRPIESERHLEIWRAMAEGLKKGDEGEHLITYHPMGPYSSSQWLHKELWLDFNMIQSSHGERYFPNYKMIEHDYNLIPVKPCFDGEPRYEDHPVGFKLENGRFNDYDVRQAAYWALFAGAFGHTYGCNNIWQMYDPGKYTPVAYARISWKESLQLPGAFQMKHVKSLILSRPVLLRIPDQTILCSEPGETAEHIQCSRSFDGSYAFVYIPLPKSVTINLDKISGNKVRAWWYDPRIGKADLIGEFKKDKERTFTPPSGDNETDWILVLDDAGKDFLPPGEIKR